MCKYETPELKILRFLSEDVITTSGGTSSGLKEIESGDVKGESFDSILDSL